MKQIRLLYYQVMLSRLICIFALLILVSFGFKVNLQTSEPKQSIKFFAGEIHFARIPVQYWEHRIQTIKAMGLNALSVYIMWNHHEIDKGKFDYTTENKNLDLFLNLAEKYNMSVLLRPGPYVCAQWDFGGLPARLYSIPNIKIRDNNQPFLDQVKIYFKSLAPIIQNHLKTQSNPNGSIILLQIQNQYGSYGSNLNYIQAIREIWSSLNITCQLYHEDGASLITNSHWPGGNIGLSGGTTQNQYNYARSVQKKGMVFGGQIYTGWLTHWGQQWSRGSIQNNIKQFTFLLSRNISFSMYLIHGGTNFGLTAGANSRSDQADYTAHVTSYDYDCPINQQGGRTPKYVALKDLLKTYVDWQVPNPPEPIEAIEIPQFKLDPVGSMLPNLGQAFIKNSAKLIPFESDQLKMYNQGFVTYQTILTQRVYYFKTTPRDFAIVVLDNKFLAILDRSQMKQHNFTVNCTKQNCNLKIIVEAMGHINYDHSMQRDIKGLFNLTDDKSTNFSWNIYRMQIDENLLKWNNLVDTQQYLLPTLLKKDLVLDKVGDTYLDATELTKGYIFVNGRNLGRYWNKGPQKRLYCPGVWLKKGTNSIYVLELLYDGKQKGISGKLTLQ